MSAIHRLAPIHIRQRVFFFSLMLICNTLICSTVQAGEFRDFRPILTPVAVAGGGSVSLGRAASAGPLKPVSRDLASTAMKKIISAWNGNRLGKVLAGDFYDKSQLSDSMNTKVPRDARLSVMAIQGVQTLGQQTEDSPSGKLLVTTVSITAKTQMTYNDPTNGYQRRDGTNEYIVRIKQRLQG